MGEGEEIGKWEEGERKDVKEGEGEERRGRGSGEMGKKSEIGEHVGRERGKGMCCVVGSTG